MAYFLGLSTDGVPRGRTVIATAAAAAASTPEGLGVCSRFNPISRSCGHRKCGRLRAAAPWSRFVRRGGIRRQRWNFQWTFCLGFLHRGFRFRRAPCTLRSPFLTPVLL
jgi:hypothetical protein